LLKVEPRVVLLVALPGQPILACIDPSLRREGGPTFNACALARLRERVGGQSRRWMARERSRRPYCRRLGITRWWNRSSRLLAHLTLAGDGGKVVVAAAV